MISQLEPNFVQKISAKITRKTLTSPGIDAETPTRVTVYYCPIPFTPPQNSPSTRLGVSRWLRVAIDSAETIIPKRICGKVRFRIGTPKSVSPSRWITTTSHGRRLLRKVRFDQV